MNISKKIFSSLLLLAALLGVAGSLALAEEGSLGPQAQKIHDLLAQNAPLSPDYKAEIEDLRTLYQNRAYAPAWNTDPKGDRAVLTAFLDSLIAFTVYHGLSDKDYPVETLRKLIESRDESDAPKLEILMTAWLIQLAHDMQGDRINLSLIYPGWSLSREKKNVPQDLGQAIAENKVQDFFNNLAPKELTYMRLADALRHYKAMELERGPWPAVSSGPTIKPGMRDPRLKQVRDRLAAESYTLPPMQPEQDLAFYDDAMKDVVIAYQSRNGLEADGNIGPITIKTMNIPIAKRIGQIMANMERMRHIPDEFPARYARVNSADSSIKVVEDGRTLYHAVVIVGRPDRKTPFIHSAIRSVIFNPPWNVPAKIAREDILPKLRKDPHYLEKMGMVIKSEGEGDPYGRDIDWNAIKKSEFNFRLRQSPGDLNSLGQIKFDFDNDFSVYLHDTSHPELFAKADRHLSSGCVRIKDPETLAEIVLAKNEGDWTLEKIQEAIRGRKTRWMQVAQPLPLYILYDTAFFPTSESLIHFRNDIYNYDQFLLTMMREEKDRK